MSKEETVSVVIRCRPFSEKEKAAGHKKIVTFNTRENSVSLENPRTDGVNDTKTFSFDAVFDEDCKQIDVYNITARKIVDSALQGYNGTVFAYGQTGSGKTFSMQGISSNPVLRGIIPNAFHHIFDHISRDTTKKYLVRVSFLEIYNEDIRDLFTIKQAKLGFNTTKIAGLELKEHPETGVYVKDLTSHVVNSVAEMEKMMDIGNEARSVGATLMNETSSRSHSIFSVTIESSEPTPDGEDRFVAGKLNLVDLAGSERQSKTGATGDRLKEATKINLSLSALGNCISALVDGKSNHIPYRDSKLTRLLQDSLGGNAKTLMIATMSPASYNFEETLSTLRYANRAKNIKNKPKINEDPKDAMLRQYQEEIEKLKKALQTRGGADGTEKKVVKKIVKVVKKKKKRVDENGVLVDVESGDEEDGVELSSLPPEEIIKLQQQVESEKQALLHSKDMVIEEKTRILNDLEKRQEELKSEKDAREQLNKRLLDMQGKLLMGGVNIFDHVNAQERELEEKEIRIQEQQKKEQELKIQLEAQQDAALQIQESYSTLQEEVDLKSKKLKKLWSKISAYKQELSDLNDEFRLESTDLLDTVRELSRELALKTYIIQHFIPPEDRVKIEKRSFYDPDAEEWTTVNQYKAKVDEANGMPKQEIVIVRDPLKRPVSLASMKRPTCQYAKAVMSIGDPNYRYRGENILSFKLDLPERTTIQISPNAEAHDESPINQIYVDGDDEEIIISGDVIDNMFSKRAPSSSNGGSKRSLSSRNNSNRKVSGTPKK